ncbi:MAG: hypothetical protein M1837_003336 [Sclerophora amabilis]|nr:MAG: hypothetical protein M1837_003336 [Sclerophora amabilis]
MSVEPLRFPDAKGSIREEDLLHLAENLLCRHHRNQAERIVAIWKLELGIERQPQVSSTGYPHSVDNGTDINNHSNSGAALGLDDCEGFPFPDTKRRQDAPKTPNTAPYSSTSTPGSSETADTATSSIFSKTASSMSSVSSTSSSTGKDSDSTGWAIREDQSPVANQAAAAERRSKNIATIGIAQPCRSLTKELRNHHELHTKSFTTQRRSFSRSRDVAAARTLYADTSSGETSQQVPRDSNEIDPCQSTAAARHAAPEETCVSDDPAAPRPPQEKHMSHVIPQEFFDQLTGDFTPLPQQRSNTFPKQLSITTDSGTASFSTLGDGFVDYHVAPYKPERALQSLCNLIRSRVSKDDGEGFVYVFQRRSTITHVKIGCSKEPEIRKKTWARTCNYTSELMGLTDPDPDPDPGSSENKVKPDDKKRNQPKLPEPRKVTNFKRLERLVFADLCKLRKKERSCNQGNGCESKIHEEWFEVSPKTALYVIDKWIRWLELEPYDKSSKELKPEWKVRLNDLKSISLTPKSDLSHIWETWIDSYAGKVAREGMNRVLDTAVAVRQELRADVHKGREMIHCVQASRGKEILLAALPFHISTDEVFPSYSDKKRGADGSQSETKPPTSCSREDDTSNSLVDVQRSLTDHPVAPSETADSPAVESTKETSSLETPLLHADMSTRNSMAGNLQASRPPNQNACWMTSAALVLIALTLAMRLVIPSMNNYHRLENSESNSPSSTALSSTEYEICMNPRAGYHSTLDQLSGGICL